MQHDRDILRPGRALQHVTGHRLHHYWMFLLQLFTILTELWAKNVKFLWCPAGRQGQPGQSLYNGQRSWLLNWVGQTRAEGGGSNNGFLGWEIAAAGQRVERSTGTQGWQLAAWEWPALSNGSRSETSVLWTERGEMAGAEEMMKQKERYHGVIGDNGGW